MKTQATPFLLTKEPSRPRPPRSRPQAQPILCPRGDLEIFRVIRAHLMTAMMEIEDRNELNLEWVHL